MPLRWAQGAGSILARADNYYVSVSASPAAKKQFFGMWRTSLYSQTSVGPLRDTVEEAKEDCERHANDR